MTASQNQVEQDANTARTVKISALIRGDKYQIRERLDQRVVGRYFNSYRNGAQLPPVQVAQVGKGALILFDGHHRVAALERLGQTTVEALIIHTEERKARWLAAQANLTHGVQLTAKERRAAFKAYIRAGQHKDGKDGYKSYRAIAEELGFMSLGGVHRRMGLDFPKLAAKMGGNENWKGQGAPDEDKPDPQRVLAGLAWGHLTDARAALEGFTDPDARGEFISKLEEMLKELLAGEYHPYAPDF
jgi:hypothetical protein